MRTLAIALSLLLALTLAACNTIQGVGKDIQKTGEVLEDATDGD
jgi:predicted small secreted protein